MGGMGTFELLYHMPRTFAAAFSICGGGLESQLAPKIAQTPLWIFHGDADNVVPVGFSIKMADAIREAKGEPLLTIYAGVGHNAWDYVFQEPELLNWLLSNKLIKP
jgi:predicted peptidase